MLPTKATLRLHSHSSRPNPLTNTPASISQDRSRLSLQSNRNLATATDHSALEPGSFSDAQYDSVASLLPSISGEFDPSSLIIIDDEVQTQPRTFRVVKGLGGDMDEMLANLHISLKLGQLDRAASLINRLSAHYPMGSPEILALHNRYLDAMVSRMILTRQHNLVLPVQRWFEVDMPNGGAEPNAFTCAVMLRMALRMLHGGKRDRTVRRYWELAKKGGLEEEVLAHSVLSELELGELSEVGPANIQPVMFIQLLTEPFLIDMLLGSSARCNG